MLKPKKKLTRRELKQDKFVLITLQAKDYIQENFRIISFAVLGAVALIVGITWWINTSRAEEMEAAAKYSDAETALINGQKDNAISLLNEIVQRYEETTAAGQSTFLLAQIYWEDNKVDLAKQYYETFLDNYADDNILTQAALVGYANCLEFYDNFAEAAKHYEKAARMETGSPEALNYLYSAARAYFRAGEYGKARQLAEEVMEHPENYILRRRAELLLESIKLSETLAQK